MNLRTLVLLLLVLAACFALVIRAIATRPVRSSPHLAEVFDNSSSQTIECDSLPKTAKSAIKQMKLGRNSRLLAFTLGEPTTSWEPELVLDMPIGTGGGLMHRSGDVEAELKRVCAVFPKSPASSIFRAVQVALETLRAKGCNDPAAPCVLQVRTDLEESVAPQIRQKTAKRTVILQNYTIHTEFCGYAVTQGGNGPRGELTDALISRWRASFADASPQAVIFKPVCDGTVSQVANHRR